MPRREDIHSILILGSGPIVIGQGCEFDYSGTQACKALQEEGFRVVLVNSNPARTYIEPITPEAVRRVLQRERDLGMPVDALLPTLGGQTALNCACELDELGTLEEFELEVVRDKNDNCIVVCGIENIDAMGVHTGDSITVAPIMTLSDKEYQRMRDGAIAIMREVGVDTGGSNVQFAVNPRDGHMIVIEMNPRVSRSSALASKATGFPIARIAALLAIGYTLDELRNDITKTTSACFEPSIDYVVTKMPRWTFEKFPESDETLTTQMKSVGEAMSIGRTFKESFQKAIRSMEVKRFGFGLDKNDSWLRASRGDKEVDWPIEEDTMIRKLSVPSQGRMYYVRYAMKCGWSLQRIHKLTSIDPWFLDQLAQLVEFEDELLQIGALEEVTAELMQKAKQFGYSDPQLAYLYCGVISTETILAVRKHRKSLGVEPVYKLVDTCAAEFEAITPYYYSTYEQPIQNIDGSSVVDDEIRISDTPKIVILGGGPNRIGQGIEFDYCCCQASFAAREMGFESVMVNSNPETVSTDFDTSDLLFFEPLTLEDTLNILERLNGGGTDAASRSGNVAGVVVQFGGQTPLNLAHGLAAAGVPIIGTGLEAIDLAEDRDRFTAMLDELELRQPENGIAYSLDEAVVIAERLGYPVLVRPSYVLGGRGMEICSDETALRFYMQTAVDVSELANAPVLIDRFLSEAIEVDVDVVADYVPHEATASRQLALSEDSPQAVICGIMEHIEQAGIHSGDSSCVLPPFSLTKPIVAEIRRQAKALALRLRVRGLMNVQLAVKDEEIYVIEVNPRASRTVPFVAKAKGIAWSRIAAKVMMGASLAELGTEEVHETGFYAVKEPVFPFEKFPGVDVVLGPEMRSTGEVMGMDRSLAVAIAKAKMAVGRELPTSGNVFLSVRDSDKSSAIEVARSLVSMGFTVFTTRGTRELLASHSVETKLIRKISEGARPNIRDLIANGTIALIINTPTKTGNQTDEGRIRATAIESHVPMITTITGARAAVSAIEALRAGSWSVSALQDHFSFADTPQVGAVEPC